MDWTTVEWLTHSTVTNTASDTTSNTGSGVGIYNYSGADATLSNTIVATNRTLAASPMLAKLARCRSPAGTTT